MTEPTDLPAADLTADDHLVEPTDNGLRQDDAAMTQPSQDPGLVVESSVDAAGEPVQEPIP